MAEDKIIQGTASDADLPDIPLNVSTNKLDADQYVAEDLDAVTENAFGLGGLSSAALNATNSATGQGAPDAEALDTSLNQLSDRPLVSPTPSQDETEAAEVSNAEAASAPTTPSLDAQGQSRSDSVGAEGTFSSVTVGSVGAATLSSDVGAFGSPDLSLDLDIAGDVTVNEAAANQPAQTTGGDEPATPNDTPSDQQDGQPIVNLTIDENIDLDVNIEGISHLTEGALTDVVSIVNNLGTSITNVAEAVIENISNLDVTNIVDVLESLDLVQGLLDTVTQNVTEVTEAVTDEVTTLLEDLLSDEQGLTIEVDAGLLDTVDLGASIPLSNLGGTGIGLDVRPEPLTDALRPIAETIGQPELIQAVDELISSTRLLQEVVDVGLGIVSEPSIPAIPSVGGELTQAITELSGTLTQLNDTAGGAVDDVLSGLAQGVEDAATSVESATSGAIDQAEAALADTGDTLTDTVNGILSGDDSQDGSSADTDIVADLDLAGDGGLLDDVPLSPNLDPVEDVVGDIDVVAGIGLDPLGDADTSDTDQDIALQADVDLVDESVADLGASVPLDPIEDVVGDIDLDLGGAADLLGQTADPVVDDQPGGSGDQSPASQIEEAAADISGEVQQGVDEVVGEAEAALADTGDTLTDTVNGILSGDDSQDGSSADTDIVADLDLAGDGGLLDDVPLSSNLDPVEDVVGDIDLDLGGAADLLGQTADPVVDDQPGGSGDQSPASQIEEAAADVTGEVQQGVDEVVGEAEATLAEADSLLTEMEADVLSLSPGESSQGGSEDTDLPLDPDLGLGDTDIAGPGTDIDLDSVEDLTGDIEEATDAATDILQEIAAPEVEDGADDVGTDADEIISSVNELLSEIENEIDSPSQTDELSQMLEEAESWTEPTVEGSGLFDDLIGSEGADTEVLPDPSGSVGEGLGVLDLTPDEGQAGLGGLF